MNDKELIEILVESEANLLVELRMGNGFQEKEYETLVEVLTVLADRWEGLNYIPNDAFLPIVEVYSEMYHFSLNDNGEASKRIRKAAEDIKIIIQRCTNETGEIDNEKAKVIARLSESIEEDGNFFEKLQKGSGLDEKQLEKIYVVLNEIYKEIYSWELLPKGIVNIFKDFYELDLYVYQYQNEFKQHDEADKIYDAYERIFSLIFG
ncbi:hypothetical protein [Metabacillus malikii]|uniref:Phenylpyruvate tautomerase PptA (4-oxalocrotonate tautomerase family) n=1 Tax=Metabacillus malikii TaxID=1504265 RepID=A0ABT9ZP23_9BACI|nr:hypothetical protein [Metabacillus malikii]MDQ0233644.1 phenylpyruvate tautomerase PptA (4-oxalocrotonate tautomerase family) [Metabacillus malikii]